MGLRIKEVIKEKEMSIQTLADKMKINRVGLSNHINGNPSVAVLEKIARALEVPIQELFVKDKNENPAKVKNIKDIDFKEISAILETN